MSLHYSNSSNKKMLSIKVLLISTSVLSIAVMLKLSMPVIADFTLSDLPSILNFLNSWLRPPYLYLIINGIIITIVASSRLQSNKADFDHPHLLPPETVKVNIPRPDVPMEYAAEVYENVVPMVEVKAEIESDYGVNVAETDRPVAVNALEDEIKSVDEIMFSKPENDITIGSGREKPPVSARFGHRKSIKASPQGGGRALGVTKAKRQDTLETTWKTITEGRPMPLARHLKKSDTWDRQHTTTTSPTATQMTKSETFNVSNQALSHSNGSGKLKKDPSLGQEELNRRVEAFIKKFNEQMRLQRQESLNQYMEMINRGAH